MRGVGRGHDARRALVEVLARHPYHRGSLQALVAFERDEGRLDEARSYAARLTALERH